MVNRRDVLAGTMLGGALSAAGAGGADAAPPSSVFNPLPRVTEPLVNFERAYRLMEEGKVDAIVCRIPTNTYYLTGFRQFWWYEHHSYSPISIMTKRSSDKIAIVMPAGTLYYQFADTQPSYPYVYYTYSSPGSFGLASPTREPTALEASH